ncbi:XkdX family protein [Lentilactobacillus sp. SPB1-3]|uniref:XkdX family protein n=1 Tax=Lentilactobacillus terminaliae TaxID=3003483 RepID=A0ACD5DDT2_9LACO|nr:XkdX family protein [Lentilactobacillus sp. SPB1-3]MCZ0978108.1 XkdX family protein [Lentilactobacillus sp. SPB1-3]
MDFFCINLFYGLGVLNPSIDWYRENGFINDDQYKQITGNDYKPAN